MFFGWSHKKSCALSAFAFSAKQKRKSVRWSHKTQLKTPADKTLRKKRKFYVTTQKFAESELRKVSCSLSALRFLCDRGIIYLTPHRIYKGTILLIPF